MKKQLFSSILIVFILLGCTPTRYDQPDQAGQQYISFDKYNLSDISEISNLSGGGDCGEITSIQVVLDKDLVYGYCSKSKELIIWNISSKIEEERYGLDVIADLGFSISNEGNLLFGPNVREDKSYSESDGLIYEVSSWAINQNMNSTCVDLCDLDDGEYYEAIRGTAISPNGNMVLVYYPFWYELFDIENNKDYRIALSHDADYFVDIGKMAFHPNKNRLAVSFRETAFSSDGDVQIFRLSGPILFFYRVYKDNSSNKLQDIKALEFSPDGKWLANITNDGVNIWRVNILKTHRLLEFNGPNIISFSGNSDILFIGTNDKLVAYDLYSKEIISIIETPNIKSISIPDGNEILAWGDSNGFIHILGIQ